MFVFPKLVVLILVLGAIWIVSRWLSGPGRSLPRRRPESPRRALDAEELTVCGLCGAYVAAGSPGCGRPDCPRPR